MSYCKLGTGRVIFRYCTVLRYFLFLFRHMPEGDDHFILIIQQVVANKIEDILLFFTKEIPRVILNNPW